MELRDEDDTNTMEDLEADNEADNVDNGREGYDDFLSEILISFREGSGGSLLPTCP